MNLRFHTRTDIGTVVFFDPSVLDGQPPPTKTTQVQVWACSGQALFFEDGGYPIAVYIGEEPPKFLCKEQYKYRENMILQVPSGRLVGTGMDDLTQLNGPLSLKEFIPEFGQEKIIPPGVYCVRAWDNDLEKIIPVDELEPDLSDLPAITRKTHTATNCLAGVGCLSWIIGAIYGIVLLGLDTLFTLWALPLIFPLVIFPATIYLPQRLIPQWGELQRRVAEHYAALKEKYPPVVIVMEKIDEIPDRFSCGSFGEGAIKP